MKTGAFAKKYGLKPSAVRFYIDKALLTPKLENGQYIFDHTCMDQMEKIIKYKNLKFTLEEIEIMLNYEHSGAVKDRAVVNTILANLEAKMIQLDAEAKDLETVKDQLAEEIKRYNDIWPVHEKPDNTAMPLDALNILCCPECFGEISVIDAVISKGGIRSAALNCECGYTAAVSDGVLLCDEHLNDTPFKLFENINSILSATDNFSPGYRNLMDKAQLWVYQQIHLQKKEFRYIMDGPFSYNFLLKHIRGLPEEALYILVDISVQKISKLKEYFSDTDRKIMFIAGDINRLPLKASFLDLYIDDFSNINHIFTYNEGVYGAVSRLLKPRGNITGIHIDYTTAPNSLEEFRKDHKDFDPKMINLKRIYSNLAMAGIKFIEKNALGSPRGRKKDFTRQVGKEKVQVISYVAEKTE